MQLVESKRVAVATPGKRAGKLRMRWQTVKTVLASVVTRTQQWILVPKSRSNAAVAQAREAMDALLSEESPAELGRRSRQRFWSMFYEARAAMKDEFTDWRLPIPPPASTA